MSEPGAAIAVEGLGHGYEHESGHVAVLDDVSLCVPGGGSASLQGPSGSGKTTLLSILGGLLVAQRGTVQVAGVSLAGLSGDDLAAFRRRTVGFVFQHFGLLDALTAVENVELAGALDGRPRARRRRHAQDLLERVGMADRARHLPHQLSGGERQRVAIARALANAPTVVLADEPTGNLDDESAVAVMDLLEQMRVDHGCAVVVVTHDHHLAARSSTRLRISGGRVARAA